MFFFNNHNYLIKSLFYKKFNILNVNENWNLSDIEFVFGVHNLKSDYDLLLMHVYAFLVNLLYNRVNSGRSDFHHIGSNRVRAVGLTSILLGFALDFFMSRFYWNFLAVLRIKYRGLNLVAPFGLNGFYMLLEDFSVFGFLKNLSKFKYSILVRLNFKGSGRLLRKLFMVNIYGFFLF